MNTVYFFLPETLRREYVSVRMVRKVLDFIRHSRLKFLTATLTPCALGGALAYHDTNAFDWVLFFLSLFGTFAAHLATNLTNDFYDHKFGSDPMGGPSLKFSGGGDAIARDGVDPMRVRSWFLLLYLAALIFFVMILALIEAGHVWIIILATLGIFAGYFYTAPPLKLAYRGLGELAIFVFLGPLPVAFTYMVQTGSLSWNTVLLSMPIGGLICGVITVNEFTDVENDALAKKNNLVVRLGKKRARFLFLSLVLFAYGVMVVPVITGYFSAKYLLALLTAPFAVRSLQIVFRKYDDNEELMKAQGFFLNAHFLGSLLLTAGVLLETIYP